MLRSRQASPSDQRNIDTAKAIDEVSVATILQGMRGWKRGLTAARGSTCHLVTHQPCVRLAPGGKAADGATSAATHACWPCGAAAAEHLLYCPACAPCGRQAPVSTAATADASSRFTSSSAMPLTQDKPGPTGHRGIYLVLTRTADYCACSWKMWP